MKRPFNIFPNIAYRNNQFQIVSTVDNLKIDFYENDKIIKSINADSKYPTSMTCLKAIGKLIAKCRYNDEIFEQEIEITDAFRLGSSELKKAFVFDDSEYSFFLMKDRLHLYDEKKKILLTENHYSPTEVHEIDKSNYLFLTRIGGSSSDIINLGIYNIESFSLVGELLNDYKQIKILTKKNKAWLYKMKSKSIHCYELVSKSNKYFTELKKHEGFDYFFIDETSQNIFIDYSEHWHISNLNNLNNSIEIPKLTNNAIDKSGNIYSLEGNTLTIKNCLTDYCVAIKPTFEINLKDDSFVHIGNQLKSKSKLQDLDSIVEKMKDDIIPSISTNNPYYRYTLPRTQQIFESYTTHKIYPTHDGVFIIQRKVESNFNRITFKERNGEWIATPFKNEIHKSSLLFCDSYKSSVLIDETSNFLYVNNYSYPYLILDHENKKNLYLGNNALSFENNKSIELLSVKEFSYSLLKSDGKYTLYECTDLNNPILDGIEILNLDLIEKHQIIWYSDKKKNISNHKYLNGFDLKTCSKMFINETKLQYSIFKDASDIKFYENYALTSNQVVFSPINLEIKDAFVGEIFSFSKGLNKIFSFRGNIIYLSIFNGQTSKYELSEIPIDDKKYRESYLSPNGQFLVLQDESNKYSFYDIEKGETINFISGSFLAFRNDGSLIVEQDGTRAVKIIDPKTFQDITPPNYHHYRFMSPDGKLYAQVSSKVRYFHKLNGIELKAEEVSKFRQDLDEPSFYLKETEKEKAKIKVDKNRLLIFNSYKEHFQSLGLEDYTKVNSHSVVKIEKYTEFGITGTSIVKEIVLPEDTQFYNYASFSYDNRYLGLVYRLGTGGGIHFIKINFDEKESSLEILDTYLSRYPRYASWVCGISKTGFFATYDSTPNTYIINVAENLFENKTTEIELRQNIYKSKRHIYHTYNKWNEIKGKNFLCFSPTGDYLALSEQGYEPLTLGGYGHQESNVVHIAKTGNGQIIDSFTGHGVKIKDDKTKKVTFVAFSEDESRIMTLSSDGVVIIREININIEKDIEIIEHLETKL